MDWSPNAVARTRWAGEKRVRGIVPVALLLAVTSCGPEPGQAPGGRDNEPATAATDTASSGETAQPVDTMSGDEWTAGITTDSAAGATGTAVVTAIRTGAHEGYDRVTIEFGAGSPVPGYNIEYVDRPLHECGSGRQIHPVGDAWLEIRLNGAAAHTEAGEPTLPERETALAGPLLLRIYRTCDFEGVVTFVIAVSAPQPYRVVELERPARLVVDFRH